VDKKPRLDFSTAFIAKQSRDAGLDKVKLHLSVSHDGDLMIAYVVAEEGSGEEL
jgi:phosphopantetheinyl transferase (holo-ACP synthase)